MWKLMNLPAAAFVFVNVPAAAQDAPAGWHYGPGMMWGGWAGMFLGPLMMILFIAAVIVLVVLALRWLGEGHGAPGTRAGPSARLPKTPLDILKERFARGEIDRAEFEERRRVLDE